MPMGQESPGLEGFFMQSFNGFQDGMYNFLKILSFYMEGIPSRSFCLLEIQRIQVMLFKKIIEIAPVFS
jgi:hypothetical protein